MIYPTGMCIVGGAGRLAGGTIVCSGAPGSSGPGPAGSVTTGSEPAEGMAACTGLLRGPRVATQGAAWTNPFCKGACCGGGST